MTMRPSKEQREEYVLLLPLAAIFCAMVVGAAALAVSHHYLWALAAFVVGLLAFMVWTIQRG